MARHDPGLLTSQASSYSGSKPFPASCETSSRHRSALSGIGDLQIDRQTFTVGPERWIGEIHRGTHEELRPDAVRRWLVLFVAERTVVIDSD